MNSALIQERLGGRLRLASLPRVAQRVKDALEHPNSSLGDVGALIALDPPLTARLLRSVNSALYGLSTAVHEPEHAASILGQRGLRNLILRAPLLDGDKMSELKRLGFDVIDLWRESLAVTRLAVLLAKRVPNAGGVDLELLETCGLLCDLGRFAMCEGLREEYAVACLRAKEERRDVAAVEYEAFGFSHNELGAMLAARWSLPEAVVKAARFHHNDRRLAEVDPLAATLMAAGELAAVAGTTRDAEACFRAFLRSLPERTVVLLGLEKLDQDRRKALVGAAVEELEQIKV